MNLLGKFGKERERERGKKLVLGEIVLSPNIGTGTILRESQERLAPAFCLEEHPGNSFPCLECDVINELIFLGLGKILESTRP